MSTSWIVLISSLSSGLIGVILSILYYRKYEKRQQKFDTLRRLLGYRFAIAETQENTAEHSREEFFAALNEAFVVFHDSPHVLKALEAYHEDLSQDNRLRLFKTICQNLKIPYEFNDSFFERPFIPGPMFRGNN